MASVYLSPSVQDYNETILGGSEEYYMNLIVDAMIPYLRASGIAYERNDPFSNLTTIIGESNAGNYGLHMALHSNASPEHLAGMLQGPDVYYYATSGGGRRAADIFTSNLKNIYPNPNLVATIPNTTLAELRRTRAPAVLIEIAYHDNYADATWLTKNINQIARNLSLSVAEFLDVSFVE